MKPANKGDDKSKSKPTNPVVPQNGGTAIPPDVVKKTVEIALSKKDAISLDAQNKLAQESKKNTDSENLAEIHGKDEEARLTRFMSEEEKAAHLKFLAAKQAHRAQAAEEERKRMQAEKQAPSLAGALSVEALDVAKRIQPDISLRAAAANKAREEKLAAEEALARQHALEEKEKRAKLEADRKAKAQRAAEKAPTFLPKPNQAPKVSKKVVVAASKQLPVADKSVSMPKPPSEPVPALSLEAPVAKLIVEVAPEVVSHVELKGPLTRQRKAKALVEKLKSKEVENRQQLAAKAEKARQEIAYQAKKAKLLETISLIGTSIFSGGALSLSGIGTSIIPLLAKIGIVFPSILFATISLPIVAGSLLGVGIYYGGKYLAAKVYDTYRRLKYSDKQRYINDLDYQIKINVSLERQFDPALQKAMIDRLDLLAAHAADPKFNDKEVLVSKPSVSKLTVLQFENEKLMKRANKRQEDCVKWDEKFLNKDENSIYLKLAKKK